MMDISTAHITRKDEEQLRKDKANLIVIPYGYGYIVMVPAKERQNSFYKQKKFSPAFNKLLNLARKNNCEYLMIDRDGEEYEELPTFDWSAPNSINFIKEEI